MIILFTFLLVYYVLLILLILVFAHSGDLDLMFKSKRSLYYSFIPFYILWKFIFDSMNTLLDQIKELPK